VFVASPKGMQQLMTDSTVTSSDFNTIKARSMARSPTAAGCFNCGPAPRAGGQHPHEPRLKNAMGMAISGHDHAHRRVADKATQSGIPPARRSARRF
jgi:hypothetical protein